VTSCPKYIVIFVGNIYFIFVIFVGNIYFIFVLKGRHFLSLLLLHWVDVRLIARAFTLGVLSLGMIDDYLVGLCVSVCLFVCVLVFERKA